MLVAGVATGDLGSQVVDELLARGKNVRALVRPSTDATKLEAQGVPNTSRTPRGKPKFTCQPLTMASWTRHPPVPGSDQGAVTTKKKG
jgi:nucleoside-diphosphate-sugar epimerase